MRKIVQVVIENPILNMLLGEPVYPMQVQRGAGMGMGAHEPDGCKGTSAC